MFDSSRTTQPAQPPIGRTLSRLAGYPIAAVTVLPLPLTRHDDDRAAQDQRSRQPPDDRAARRAGRAAAPDRGRVPAAPTSTCGATRSASTGPTPTASAGLFDELVSLMQAGHPLEPAGLARTIDMVKADESAHRGVLHRGAPHRSRADRAPQVGRPEALRRRHRGARHHLRHRSGRHRQELAGGGHGGPGAAGQGGRADHPHPPRGRGRRAARLPARRPHGQDRPLPAPALRRAATTWSTPRSCPSCWSGARSRWRRWRSCAAAPSTTASSSSTRPRTPPPSR